MIRNICKDILILQTVSSDASIDDIDIANDLLDTLIFHKEECVGMAANMIGVNKRIIVFYDEKENNYKIMFNPIIINKKDEYETEEGCLSLGGVRKTKRYKTITVEYQNMKFEHKRKTYRDYTAQIIQHEIDMCNGILI